jgi:hypothetical protein
MSNEIVTETEKELSVSTTPENTKASEAPAEEKSVATESAEAEAPVEATSEPDKSDEDAKPKPKSRAQERIEQLARDKRNLLRQLSKSNQEIGRLRAEKAPSEDDFADITDYQVAKLDRKVRESTLEREHSSIAERAEELRQARSEAFAERMQEAAIPGFDLNRFYSDVPVTEAMADVLMQSPRAAELANYLLINRAEALGIAKLTPAEQAFQMGRLEGRVAPPKPKHVSTAPKPVTTVSGQAHASGRSLDEMSYDEFRKAREAQLKARGRY